MEGTGGICNLAVVAISSQKTFNSSMRVSGRSLILSSAWPITCEKVSVDRMESRTRSREVTASLCGNLIVVYRIVFNFRMTSSLSHAIVKCPCFCVRFSMEWMKASAVITPTISHLYGSFVEMRQFRFVGTGDVKGRENELLVVSKIIPAPPRLFLWEASETTMVGESKRGERAWAVSWRN